MHEDWADCLHLEASLCAAAVAMPDCAAGVAGLSALQAELRKDGAELAAADGRFGELSWHEASELRGPQDEGGEGGEGGEGEAPPAWEHAALGEVGAAALAPYLPHAR